MSETREIYAVYFIGAGGIGMSALARYFLRQGLFVAGYDKTPSPLTLALESEGMVVHYTEDIDMIPLKCRDARTCLVVYTPAIPENHKELAFFRAEGFTVEKRAQVLGRIVGQSKGVCIAGTHGKTTTSAMCAHLLYSSIGCSAFLGGIAKNYGSNYLLAPSEYVVVEADEYDRSFHWLHPYLSVITSADADHLDIYGSEKEYKESFSHYTELIRSGGALVVHRDVDIELRVKEGVRVYSYSREEGDFHAENIIVGREKITFDLASPIARVENISLSPPIPINIDNSIAALALAQLCGCSAEELREGMSSFAGVERRFDVRVSSERRVLLSDYAHHPKEILRSAQSIRQMYPGRRLTVMFQPHLYSRTRDFYEAFASALSLFDEVLLLDIYPAREAPIEGVSSSLIFDRLAPEVEKRLIRKEDVLPLVGERDFDVLVLLGAGDLESYAKDIEQLIRDKE